MESGEKVLILSGPYQGMAGEILREIPGGFELRVRVFGALSEVLAAREAVQPITASSVLPYLEKRIQEDIRFGVGALMDAWWGERVLEAEGDRVGEWLAFCGFRDGELKAWQEEAYAIRDAFRQQYTKGLESELGPAAILRRFEHESRTWLANRVAVEAAVRKDELGADGRAEQLRLGKRRRWNAFRAWWLSQRFSRALPAAALVSFRKLNQVDPRAGVEAEEHRLLRLRNAFVEDFGMAAVAETLRPMLQDAEFHTLEEAPVACPWKQLAGLQPDAALKRLFEKAPPAAQTLVEVLNSCLRALFVMRRGKAWYLLYVVNGSFQVRRGEEAHYEQGIRLLAGGAPKKRLSLPAALKKANWELPPDLSAFYKAHDGFGLLQGGNAVWQHHAVLPMSSLGPKSSPCEALNFWTRPSGVSQAFVRVSEGEISFETARIRPESDAPEDRAPFWSFLPSALLDEVI